MSESKRAIDNRGSVPERRYRKPPVIEALCEIYFSGSAWDETVPGGFYERLKNDFPQKRQRKIQEEQITLGPEPAVAGVRRRPSWMQFVSGEKHRMVQMARDLLVVNQLAPYPHFEEWEPDIYDTLRVYSELSGPQRISRIGVRYINRVVIPGLQLRLEDFFTVYPNLPKSLGDAHGPFMVRVEVPKGDHRVLITLGTAPLPPKADSPAQAFMLDLYDILTMDRLPEEGALKDEIHRAHDNIVVAFEDSIMDQLRNLFELEG